MFSESLPYNWVAAKCKGFPFVCDDKPSGFICLPRGSGKLTGTSLEKEAVFHCYAYFINIVNILIDF